MKHALDERTLDPEVPVVIEPALVLFRHAADQLDQVVLVGEVFAFHLRLTVDRITQVFPAALDTVRKLVVVEKLPEQA